MYKRDWWDEKIIGFFSRNDATLIGLVILAGFMYFGINWDVVFGLRPPH